ncbi:sulfotransferase domain-containing protein [Marinibaculum pumilum]|uniref:Sulfotransferase domain-containing protein n=1 Tax=Marinibaculum pumilum TaxID=1766165 RepID=A0ABV7KUX6_9PROT
MAGIIWLASYPKSGNTWLRAFLHNLLRDPAKPMDINQLTQFTHGDTLRHWFDRAAGESIEGWSEERIAQLRPEVHRLISESWPDSVFVKTHNALAQHNGVPLITMEYTTAAIYVVRDPRDVAISMTHHFGLTLDQAITMMGNEAAATAMTDLNVQQFYGTWSEHVESWTDQAGQSLHVVRYEDMHSRPRAAFGGVVQFLGLPPDRKRLDKAIRFASFKVLQGQERKEGFREKSVHADAFFRSGQVGQWRRIMTPEQAAAIETAHGTVMRRFGYL